MRPYARNGFQSFGSGPLAGNPVIPIPRDPEILFKPGIQRGCWPDG